MAEDTGTNVAPSQSKAEPKNGPAQPPKFSGEPKPVTPPKMEASIVPPATEQPKTQPQPPVTPPAKVASPGQIVGGVIVVDPVAKLDETRKDLAPKQKAAPSKAKVSPMGEVRELIEKALAGDKEVTVLAMPDHPRGAAVAIFRSPDPTRPRAYVTSSDGTWSKKSLTLNLYSFMNAGEAGHTQARVLGALEMTPRQVGTFSRF